jgi:hypothetical protein
MSARIQIEQELLALKADNPMLQAAAVVKWAKANKQSALHKQFQWDLKKAAWEHWLSTARHLIVEYVIHTVDNGPRLVSLSVDRITPGGGYRDIGDIVSVPALYEVMLRDAISDLRRTQTRYQRVKELKRVWEELDKIDKPKKGGKRSKAGSSAVKSSKAGEAEHYPV